MTQRAWNWSRAATAATFVAGVVAVLTCAFGAGTKRGGVDERLDKHDELFRDHGKQLGDLQSKGHARDVLVAEVAADVRWLRRDREAELRQEVEP